MALRGVGAAAEAALVARDGVLVGFDAAVIAVAVAAERDEVGGVGEGGEEALRGAERVVGGRDDLDEVHVVVGRVVGRLGGGVERVEVVVRPGHGVAQVLGHLLGELGPEAQLVDLVREGVPAGDGALEVVVQVVHVHVAVAEAAARRDVEVADDLVDAQPALDAAAFFALRVQPLAVVLSLALLDVLAAAEGPRHGGVGFAHLFARVAAAGFDGVGGSVGAVAAAAVVGVEVHGDVVLGVAALCG